MSAIRPVSLGLQFLLELAALAAVAYWGWGVTWVLGVAAPAAWIVLWAVFGSPRAKVKLTTVWRLAFELVMFGAATVALWAAGQAGLRILFGVVCIANRAVLTATE